MIEVKDRDDALPFLTGGGETGALMRSYDWSTSPLRPPADWPQSLRTVVGLMLNSRFPMFLAWGEELGFLFNDGYAPILGGKRAGALGRPFAQLWSDIWTDVEPLVARALAGEAVYHENLRFVMHRNGYPEDSWYTFSYSPIRDESGRVAGIFCACTETTGQVLAERQRADETERQRRMFAQAPGFICTLRGPDHVFDFVNDAHVRLFGERGAVGRTMRQTFPDLVDQEFEALLDRVYATGERHVAHGAPVRFRTRPDGLEEERFLDFIYEPIVDEAGTVVGIFCEGHDVTERVRADHVLRETGARETFLVALGDTLRPMSDPREIVAATTRALGERLGAMRVVYAEIDEAEGIAITEGDWTDGAAAHLPDRLALADFGAELVAALRAGVTLVVPDVRVHPATLSSGAMLDAIGVGALVSVPLVKDGRFVANLNVHSREPHDWTAAEIELAEAVASRTWDVLERARAVAELAKREHELNMLTDALPVLISYVDRDERYRFNNKAYEEWFGHRREELYGRHVRDVIGDAAYEDLKTQIHRTLAGERVSSEQLVPYKDGGERHVHIDYLPRIALGGEVEGYYALIQDISDRRAAEAALGESESRFRSMADRAPVMMWVTNPDGFCTYLNARWYEFTGQAVGEGEGLGWLDAVHPDDRPLAETAFLTANAEQRDYQVDFRVRRADGVYRWAIDAAAARFNEAGDYLGYVGSVIDIDERKGVEEALVQRVVEQTAERNRVWEMSRDLFAIMGFDGYLKAINPAWETTLGLDAATLLAMPFGEQVHPDDHAAVRDVMDRLLRGESVNRFEDRLRHADGSWRWISWALVPEDDVFYAVGRDVTAEKEAALELEQAQEALRQSQKMEAMGQLTGGVAHDFNNLLTPIVGSLDMLIRRGLGNERERRLIDGALQSAERAKTLVQRLLAFARRQPLQASAVDLPQLVAGMAGLVGSTIGPKIDIRVELAEGLPPARADANQLEMALLNLAVNARDAMPDGGTLTIAAAPATVPAGGDATLKPGPYVRLSVSDTGMGMDAETVRRAIEPFFSTKGIGKGTGLGLSMVHGLAAQLGGGLDLESRPGHGTTVALWLPVSAGSLAGEADAPSLTPTVKARGRALLVDDEELVRMSTADMLTDLGYDVVEAGSAEEALALLRQGIATDLLVTDHLMPGMSGAELARAARALDPDLPILIVSGYAEVDGIAPDLPRLTKPFRNAELAERLASLAPRATMA